VDLYSLTMDSSVPSKYFGSQTYSVHLHMPFKALVRKIQLKIAITSDL
jgi:hypothetical protein